MSIRILLLGSLVLLAPATTVDARATAAPAAKTACAKGKVRLSGRRSLCVKVRLPKRPADAHAEVRWADRVLPTRSQKRLLSRTRRRRDALLDLPLVRASALHWSDWAPYEGGTGVRYRRTTDEAPEGNVGTISGAEIEARHGDEAVAQFSVQGVTMTACPDADGLVNGKWEYSLGQRVVTRKEGMEYRQTLRGTFEATVGEDARLRKWRYAAEGDTEVKSFKVDSKGRRRHAPTRRWLINFTRQGLDPRTRLTDDNVERQLLDPETGVKGRYFGPRGSDVTQLDKEVAGHALAVIVLNLEDDARKAMLDAEKQWYDNFKCVRTTIDGPREMRAGQRASFTTRAVAKDGAPVSGTAELETVWQVGYDRERGSLSAQSPFVLEITKQGTSTSYFSVIVTSRRGRGRSVVQIFPPPPQRWRFDVTVVYDADMGSGIVPTHLNGSGQVTDEQGGGTTEGWGYYGGYEWDGTPENTCGEDMERTRTFSGEAVVGADIHDDGTVTIAFTAPERIFDFSWIVTVPLSGGTSKIQGTRPFCGEPGKARTTAVVTVTGKRV
jgi:hypothetical protein